MTDIVEEIQRFNDDTAAAQLTPQALAANNVVAEQSLAHAETVRGIAQPIQDNIWALEAERGAYQEHQIRDLQTNSILHDVLSRKIDRLNPEWGEDRTPEERWVSKDETLRRQAAAERLGILVRCTVQWGTGTPNNPLLMINTILSPRSETYFPTHAAKNAANERHLSVAHMNDLIHAFNDPPGYWKELAKELFEMFNNREVVLFPEPFYDEKDTAMTLDSLRDPLASNFLVQMLNSTYKPGQDRGFHITL